MGATDILHEDGDGNLLEESVQLVIERTEVGIQLVDDIATNDAVHIEIAGSENADVTLNLRPRGAGTVRANTHIIETQNRLGAADGYASLDSGSKVPTAQLPEFAGDGFPGIVPDPGGGSGTRVLQEDGGWVEPTAGTPGDTLGTRRTAQWQHEPYGSATWAVSGSNATADQVGATASDVDTTHPFERQQTAASSGAAAGRISSTAVTQRSFTPTYTWHGSTVGNVTNIRFWVGLVNGDVSAVNTPNSTEVIAAFRYDTGVDGSAFWRCVTYNAVPGDLTVTASSVAVTTNTLYEFTIEMDASEVRFYINGNLEATHTTDLPATGTHMFWEHCVTSLTTAAKSLLTNFVSIVH